MEEFNKGDIIIWEDYTSQPPSGFCAECEYQIEYHDNGFLYISSHIFWTDDFNGYVKKDKYIKDRYGFIKGDVVFYAALNLKGVLFDIWVDGNMLKVEIFADNGLSYYTDHSFIILMSEVRNNIIDDILT